MPLPQVNERIKEVPAQALRAVFAGIGQVLLVADKIRNRTAEQASATAPATAASAEAPSTVPAAAPSASPTSDAGPAAKVPAAEAPAAKAPPVEAPATEVPPTPQAPAAHVAAKSGGLPLSNYYELTIPSLRARMRLLSAAQVTALLDYERATQARAAVITMFERRLAKLEQEDS